MLLLGEKEGERATGPWLGEENEVWGFGGWVFNEGFTGGPARSEPAPAAAPAVCLACQQIPG